MTPRMRFYFDPICPWSYQTSRWARRLAELREVELEWGLFSLELVNATGGDLDDEARAAKGHARSAPALRAAVLVREAHGASGVGRFYAELGRRVHQLGEPIEQPDTVEGALRDAQADPALAGKALSDEATWDQVVSEHQDLVGKTRSFGVPTIMLLDADGNPEGTIFGPVISEVPTDEDAVELFRHVAWLTRYDNFSELKRDRTIGPDLESFRRAKHARAD